MKCKYIIYVLTEYLTVHCVLAPAVVSTPQCLLDLRLVVLGRVGVPSYRCCVRAKNDFWKMIEKVGPG